MKDISNAMNIEFQNKGVLLPASKTKMLTWMRAAIVKKLATSTVMTVRFVGSAEGLELNSRFRQKNYATNILTFAYTRAPLVADLVLCTPVVRREARQRGISLEAHLAHLLVHGCLHAQGFDHELPSQAIAMEAKERQILRHFGIADPYRLVD
jgi:probable rRNA maturation factor